LASTVTKVSTDLAILYSSSRANLFGCITLKKRVVLVGLREDPSRRINQFPVRQEISSSTGIISVKEQQKRKTSVLKL
jgi:hypothetical protein